jgi:hypothetical protein
MSQSRRTSRRSISGVFREKTQDRHRDDRPQDEVVSFSGVRRDEGCLSAGLTETKPFGPRAMATTSFWPPISRTQRHGAPGFRPFPKEMVIQKAVARATSSASAGRASPPVRVNKAGPGHGQVRANFGIGLSMPGRAGQGAEVSSAVVIWRGFQSSTSTVQRVRHQRARPNAAEAQEFTRALEVLRGRELH